MNLKDKRPRSEESVNSQKNMNSGTLNSNGSLLDLINQQSEVIQKQDCELQKLRSEMQKKDEKIVKQNEKLVTLNEKIALLNSSDLELQESRKIKASAAEERLAAAREREESSIKLAAVNQQKEFNALEAQRLKKERQELDLIIQNRLERELSAKQKAVSLRLAKEWYSSLMLIIYSVVMTVYYIIVHWQTVLTGEIFFIRFEKAFTGIWEAAWPAVYRFWYWQTNTETGALIGSIITAVFATGAVFGLIKLFLWWKKRVDDTYDKNDHRKTESLILILSSSLVFALIICSRTSISMSWIMLWILVTTATSVIYQTVRIIWFAKARQYI